MRVFTRPELYPYSLTHLLLLLKYNTVNKYKIYWGDFVLGGFCPRGDFVLGGFCPRGILSGGFCPGGFCPDTLVKCFVQQRGKTSDWSIFAGKPPMINQ